MHYALFHVLWACLLVWDDNLCINFSHWVFPKLIQFFNHHLLLSKLCNRLGFTCFEISEFCFWFCKVCEEADHFLQFGLRSAFELVAARQWSFSMTNWWMNFILHARFQWQICLFSKKNIWQICLKFLHYSSHWSKKPSIVLVLTFSIAAFRMCTCDLASKWSNDFYLVVPWNVV
jgi:hypothetical protein